MVNIPKITLNDQVEIPALGLGTYKNTDEKICIDTVEKAIELGYRHIDTASIYQNEAFIGKALKNANVPREELFVVSKLWNSHHGYDEALRAFEKTLKDLQLDYLDMYMIHWPKPDNIETWKAFEKLYEEKLIRTLGVCNFKMYHLEDMMAYTNIKPSVNQVEYHPQFTQNEVHDFCKLHNIRLEAWAPLMKGEILSNNLVQDIAKKYDKTPAQVILRWDTQKDVITIPKTVHAHRLEENMNIFDFELSKEDILAIDGLNKDRRIGPDPDSIDF